MSELSPSELVREIHAAAGQAVIGLTGGGSRAIAELLEVPGGSRTLLEAVVPYSSAALVTFLGGQPEQFCSARTARAMAMAAFQRGRKLQSDSPAPSIATSSSPSPPAALPPLESGKLLPLVGIGCTASLVSDRPKRGPHRVHVALQTPAVTSTHSLDLIKGRRTRAEEEAVATRLILNAVAEACGVSHCLPLPLIETEQLDSVHTAAGRGWQDLLLGRTTVVAPAKSNARVVFPGAFNPLHAGHRQMAKIAAQRLNALTHFEISIENVDKLPLDYTEMQQRAAQFEPGQLPLWFTRAPTFEQKSAIFPGATFIVGVDTLARIGQPCYYHNDPAAAEAAVQQIAERGCRFLVFGRVMGEKFQTLDDLQVPASLRKLCELVSVEEFRVDMSSTELRRTSDDA